MEQPFLSSYSSSNFGTVRIIEGEKLLFTIEQLVNRYEIVNRYEKEPSYNKSWETSELIERIKGDKKS